MKNYLTKYYRLAAFLMITGMLIHFISQCEGSAKSAPTVEKKDSLKIRSVKEASRWLHEYYIKTYRMDFLPLEEHSIGHKIAASLLQKKRLYGNGSSLLEKYIANIGNTLSMASERPETFQGYRFIILHSKSIRTYAVPGGYIFITTGLIKMASNEEELAGVIAHSVSHVVLKHPTKSIGSARKIEFIVGLIKYRAS